MYQQAGVAELGTADTESRFGPREDQWSAEAGDDGILEEDAQNAAAELFEHAAALGLCADGRRRGDTEDDDYVEFDDDDDDDDDEDYYEDDVEEEEENDDFDGLPDEDDE